MKVWAKDGVIIQIGVCSGYRGTQQDCRQQERINSGLQGGNLAGAMGLEPAEGSQLFASRQETRAQNAHPINFFLVWAGQGQISLLYGRA